MSFAAVLASFAVFLLIHAVIRQRSGCSFEISLKLSRGVAAALLVAAGFDLLRRFFPLWRQIFLFEEPGRPLSAYVVGALVGHLLADVVWILYGVRLGAEARRDLVIHHCAGLVVCGVAIVAEAGYTLIGVLMTTELLPVTTGIGGAGEALGSERLKSASVVLGLAVLVLWRLPCWVFLGARTVWILRAGEAAESLLWVYPICLVFAVFIVALDLFWCRLYVGILRKRSALLKGAGR